MTREDRLRSAFRAYADRVEPDPVTWARVQTGLGRRRWTRFWGAGLAVAAVTATAVIGALLFIVDDDPTTQVSVRPAATVPTVATTAVAPSTTASTTPSGHVRTQMSATIVASGKGGLVVLDSTTGEVVRMLATLPEDSEVGFGTVVLSPNGATAYYEIGEGGGAAIWTVEVAGGTPRILRQSGGYSLDLSPDGRFLAYVSVARGGLYVLDLKTMKERAWTISDDGFIPDLPTWTPDGRHLLFVARRRGEEAWALYRLDRFAASLALAQRLGPSAAVPGGTSWWSPSLRGYDGLIGLIESCCARDTPMQGGRALVVVDPATGAGVGRSYLSIDAVRLAYDRSGDHMLLFTEDGRLYRRSGGEAPVKVADGIVAAAW